MDEYITKAQAIDIAESLRPIAGNGITDAFIKGIEGVEAAEVVKHGKWDASGRYQFKDGKTAVVHPECGCALTEKEYEEANWFFCPVCGTSMDN